MNFNNNASDVSQDIWDCTDEVFDDQDECSPQMPNFTKQFTNTLKDNKGKANIADFEESEEVAAMPEFIRQLPSDEELAAQLPAQQVKRKSKRKLKDYKPNTYDVKTSSKWRGLNLTEMDKKELRRLPSDQILKVLFTERISQ
eukprot:CAMPEP_0196994594 /NCGR_PEP_ID=MMETSP1380-20130617/871_1 /TAXON_ID=5936 /ORGANISM="Euplotes crassus, Strain CT5" /LENGTH=142 /DNA_ID=CAMNT_0042410013 /DNA_START=1 /DNA_END=429 /DNA_ORIENTATION=+